MSVLTIAIIVAVVLIPLFYKDCADHSLPDELGYVVFGGIIIDFIVIAICAAKRFGRWGFIISAIILVCIFFGIDEYTDRLHKKRRQMDAVEEEINRKNGKSFYEWRQSERCAASAKANGPAYGFMLVGPIRDFGVYGSVTVSALFGESPEDIVNMWKGLAVPIREYGDSNGRTIHFDVKEDDTIHYQCTFKHERLYYVREYRRTSHKEYRLNNRTLPNYEMSNYRADNALWDWEKKYPFVNHPEESISVLEDGIQLRSKKINAVAVKKAYNKWEKESYSEKKIRSEWEVIAPDDKKIKCICEWGSQKIYDDGDILHQCYISQEYELVE